jgi:hypothetical protein
MTDQQALWQQVNAIKRQVRNTIGPEACHAFRSTSEYQGYTGLCGEAQMAYEDGELDAELVVMLTEHAQRVTWLWHKDRN